MSPRRPQFVLAYLLGLLGLLMGFHLLLLQTGLAECDAYQRLLIERLKTVKVGSPEAKELKGELFAYLDGRASECAGAEETYAEAADKYLATLLALITGAGVGAATSVSSPSQSGAKPDSSDAGDK